jgi:hypothetical protein
MMPHAMPKSLCFVFVALITGPMGNASALAEKQNYRVTTLRVAHL